MTNNIAVLEKKFDSIAEILAPVEAAVQEVYANINVEDSNVDERAVALADVAPLNSLNRCVRIIDQDAKLSGAGITKLSKAQDIMNFMDNAFAVINGDESKNVDEAPVVDTPVVETKKEETKMVNVDGVMFTEEQFAKMQQAMEGVRANVTETAQQKVEAVIAKTENKEEVVVEKNTETAVTLYDKLDEQMDAMTKKLDELADKGKFGAEFNQMQRTLVDMRNQSTELAKKYKNEIFAPERMDDMRRKAAQGIRTTVDATHGFNADIIDLAVNLVKQTADLLGNGLHTINNGGQALGHNVANAVEGKKK